MKARKGAAMLEDFRDHDPNPTVHERAWMQTNPYPAVVRVLVLAMVAVMVGLSTANEPSPETPSPVSVAARTAG
jgi:hypothetical protein